jgi:hypothetical protein
MAFTIASQYLTLYSTDTNRLFGKLTYFECVEMLIHSISHIGTCKEPTSKNKKLINVSDRGGLGWMHDLRGQEGPASSGGPLP